MASFLRQIVAGPRAQHTETGLDLCYVTSNIIATSGPSQTFPKRAYRNPLDTLVKFLDSKHGENWAIWEFRAEGTGYPDEAVYNRIRHYPWPDHHPPPFRLVPIILGSMRQWLQGEAPPNMDRAKTDDKDFKRVVVVHCKAGKGRSGTMACSYLIAECGWKPKDALARFTQRRMRPNFGEGISIPSQLRWVHYVDRWTRHGKKYVDLAVEIVEIRVWGLRHGVKLSVEGYVNEGKKIHVFHTFKSNERHVIEGDPPGGGGFMDLVSDMAGSAFNPASDTPRGGKTASPIPIEGQTASKEDTSVSAPSHAEDSGLSKPGTEQTFGFAAQNEPGGKVVLFKPDVPVTIPNSDVNIALERRNKTTVNMGFTMVTSLAHVWFNAFFEGNGPEQDGRGDNSGVFAIAWEQLDGIKGSSQKGSQAATRLEVVWRVLDSGRTMAKASMKENPGTHISSSSPASVDTTAANYLPGEIRNPRTDEDIPQMEAANWTDNEMEGKNLGLRREEPSSVGVSRASSVKSTSKGSGTPALAEASDNDPLEAVKSCGPDGDGLDHEDVFKPQNQILDL